MKENSINKKEVDNGIKINIPIISNQEIENTINTENLYDKIAKQIYHDREMIILQEFIKKLQKENEELNNRCRNLDKEAQAYLEELAGDNTLTRRTIKQLQEENEELKNNIRKNENELEFDVNCDWIALQKMLDESEKSNEYISYKNEKWIKEKYCIPIQKIKAKIEELDIAILECIYLDDDDKAYKKAVKKDKLCLLNQKRALQELLEGGNLE